MSRFLSTKTLLVAASVLVVGPLAACGSSSATSSASGSSSSGHWAKTSGTIVFGGTPDQAGSDSNYKPLEDYIAKKTGYKVEYYPTSDYTALIAAAVAGKIDVMSSGALQYVMAQNKGAQLTPVSAVLSSSKVQDPGYYSVAIAPASSSATTLADAKGKKVCFVDPNSTSGYLFGLYQLKKAGMDVNSTGTDASGNPQFKDFQANFAGAHDKSAQTVASGQCDAGFAEDTVAQPMIDSGKLKKLGQEYVPGGPLSISSTLPDDAKKKLTDALQSASVENIKAENITLTDGFSKGYFGVKSVDASYYKSISDLCDTIPAAKCSKK